MNVGVVTIFFEFLGVDDGEILGDGVPGGTRRPLCIGGAGDVVLFQPHDHIPYVSVSEGNRDSGGESPPLLIHKALAYKAAVLQHVEQHGDGVHLSRRLVLGSSEDGFNDFVVRPLHDRPVLSVLLHVSLRDRQACNSNSAAA